MNVFQRILTAENLLFMLKGAGYSLLVAIAALAGGSILALLAAMAKMSKIKILRVIANVYVEVIRGTPMMLQIVILYLCGPVITRTLFHYVFTPNPLVVGTIAIGINSGAYTSELFRSAIQSIDKGQWEAARSIGLSETHVMTRIILPQAVKNILPALCNEFISTVKGTSLASVFFVGELMTSFKTVQSATFLALQSLTIVGIIYFLLNFILSRLLRVIERRLTVSD